MNSSVKRILIFGLVAGGLILVSLMLIGVCASSPPPHLILFGSAKQFGDNTHPVFTWSSGGASISISNAGPEDILLTIESQPRLVRSPFVSHTGILLRPRYQLFKQGQVMKLGDYLLENNGRPFHIEATTQSPFTSRAFQSVLDASRALWITWDPVHARNVYNAEMKRSFLGRTYDFVKTIDVEPPDELGEAKQILIHLKDEPDATPPVRPTSAP